jgi:hypothetical protein
VQLLCAKGLKPADTNGLADPYVKVSLGEARQRSRCIKKTLNPVWRNEVFTFRGVLGKLLLLPLKMTLWDQDIMSRDDVLGPWVTPQCPPSPRHSSPPLTVAWALCVPLPHKAGDGPRRHPPLGP